MISVAYVALWIFVFSLPWESSTVVIPGVGVVSRLIGILAIGLALLAVVVSGRIRRWHGFHLAALLFVIWAGATLLVVYSPSAVPKKFWTYVQLFLMVVMIWEIAPSGKRLLGLLLAYVFGAYVAAFDTILVYRSKAGMMRRFAAGGADPNDLAMTLALALPMAWYLGMKYRQPLLRWACRLYLPVGVLAIGLTGSRGGLLACMVALLIVPLAMTRLSPGRLTMAIAMLGISGALAVAYVPERLVQRLATTSAVLEEGGLGGRLRLWRAGVRAFARKPLIGHGVSGFKTAVSPELGIRTQVAHNSYLSVLVEEGIVGLLLYLMMFLAVFLAVLNLPPLERRFGLVLLTTVAVAMLPLTWEDRKAVWFILAALVGMARAQAGARGGAVWQPRYQRAASIAGPRMAARPTLGTLHADGDATA